MTMGYNVLNVGPTSTKVLIVKMKKVEVKLAKVYKTSLLNEAKLKMYLAFRETNLKPNDKK